MSAYDENKREGDHDMESKEQHIIKSTSPNDLTMDQRYAFTLKFADLVMRAKGYERVPDPDETIKNNGRRVNSGCR